MTFDPTWPPAHVHASSAKFREQFNGLNDKIDAIPAGPPGPPGADGNDGADGATGPQGPQGDPGTLPTNPAILPGRIISDNGDLTIALSDPNGSGETSLQFSVDTSSGTPVLVITVKVSGATVYSHRFDLAGVIAGAGVPSVQHGDIPLYDIPTQAWKPGPKPALNPTSISPLGLTISDPPTQAEVQAIADKLDQILAAITRP